MTPLINISRMPLHASTPPFRVLNKIGLGKSLLVRLPRDISDLKITHDAVNGKVRSAGRNEMKTKGK